MQDASRAPVAELHVWQARLDADGWPGVAGLPSVERDRAAAIQRHNARRRWIASRWALRKVLAGYLGLEPAEIELRFGSRGKPMLADSPAPLQFNLSHSDELALIAVAGRQEVGVDVQLTGPKPAEFYAAWTRREAVAKCHGTGLGAAPPDAAVAVSTFDAGAGFAASIAVAGDTVPRLRRFAVQPG